jgi:purine-binding chemotaxis protein CheW
MAQKQFASFYIGENLFGVDVRLIREINRSLDITPVDGAPRFIRGLLNLRGQIVTVIDVRRRMGLPGEAENSDGCRCVVLKTTEELAGKRAEDETIDQTSRDLTALFVDSIGDMVSFDDNEIESSPANMGEVEGRFIQGIVKLEKELLIILKVTELLQIEEERGGK